VFIYRTLPRGIACYAYITARWFKTRWRKTRKRKKELQWRLRRREKQAGGWRNSLGNEDQRGVAQSSWIDDGARVKSMALGASALKWVL